MAVQNDTTDVIARAADKPRSLPTSEVSDELKRALALIQTAPTVEVVLAGRALGISRNTAYKAVRDGSLPAFKIAGQYRVPTAKLREMLGIPAADGKAA